MAISCDVIYSCDFMRPEGEWNLHQGDVAVLSYSYEFLFLLYSHGHKHSASPREFGGNRGVRLSAKVRVTDICAYVHLAIS